MQATAILPSHPFISLRTRRGRMSVRSAVSDAPAATDRKSLYEVLRIKRNASQREIKTAYRTLAKLYHPDAASRFVDSSIASSEADGGDFMEIHDAYSTLSDPDARALYDFNLSVGSRRRFAAERLYSVPYRRWETEQCW